MPEAVVQSATLQALFGCIQQLQEVAGASDALISNGGFNFAAESFSPTTTIPVTRASYQRYTMAGGAIDLDLTALKDAQSNLNLTGLKVQLFVVRNLGANAMIVADQLAANKYDVFGAGNEVDLPGRAAAPFCLAIAFSPESLPDVGAAAKIIRVSGTNGDQFDTVIWAG